MKLTTRFVIIFIFAALLTALNLASGSSRDLIPSILSASVSPQKVRPGDTMVVTAEAKDD